MNTLNEKWKGARPADLAVVFPMLLLLGLIAIELSFILWLNGGKLTFTLDDAYIHLALAENIAHGHYGVNLSEFSAPSSSAIWPFLIAPIAWLPGSEYAILAINSLAASTSLYMAGKVMLLSDTKNTERRPGDYVVLALTLILLIPALNLVGLVFTGMEHSVQVLCMVFVVYGMTLETKQRIVPVWLAFILILAPLIRYECLAISVPALLFLYVRGYRSQAVKAGIMMALSLASFSFFLHSMELQNLPSSVQAKSLIVSSSGKIEALALNFQENLFSPSGFRMAYLAGFVGILSLTHSVNTGARLLALVSTLCLVLHLLFGRFGSYDRYEIYVLGFLVVMTLSICSDWILRSKNGALGILLRSIVLLVFGLLIGIQYLGNLITTPVAANNIFEQQYQMHRFVTDYFPSAVAVNDLGYVSFRNNQYVLDLWGLASADALSARLKGGNSTWMESLVSRNDVKYVMIYEQWFESLPEDWIKVAELRLGRDKITPAQDNVSFFAPDCLAVNDLYTRLNNFEKSLPKGVVLKVESGTSLDSRCQPFLH